MAALGGRTLAVGLKQVRQSGRRIPTQLMRRCRELDAASALLRHPGDDEVDSIEENARKLCEGQDWVLEVMSPKALFRILRLDKYLYRRACTVWPQTEILE